MPDNDHGAGGGAVGLDRTERRAGSKAHPARVDADEARFGERASKRAAHRKAYPAKPKVQIEQLLARLPDPLIVVDADDVCSETLLIVDLLGNDAIDIS